MDNNNVARLAFMDISKHLLEEVNKVKDCSGFQANILLSKLFITPEKWLNTSEQRRLNRELGISNLNYWGNRNGTKRVSTKFEYDGGS